MLITRREFIISGLASLLISKASDGYTQTKTSNAIIKNKMWAMLNRDEKNNRKCVDLSDMKNDPPLNVTRSTQILWRTEQWEYGYEDQSLDTLGYPSVVKNIQGLNPDDNYYLFYSHHDNGAAIGAAISKSIEGPYTKIKNIDPKRSDSRVLSPLNAGPGYPLHYSSPCVVWNEEEQLWFMYFHYFDDEFDKGKGHQKTALATCSELGKHAWKPWVDEHGKLIPVLPTTAERWMNSQSSYHAIQRLPNGKWLAFMRGTGGSYKIDKGNRQWVQDPCKLGFAESSNGRNWKYFSDNPVISQNDIQGRDGVYRPHFIGYLGNNDYLLVWSESKYYDLDLRVIYGRTSDFKKVVRDNRGLVNWAASDGLVSPWKEGRYVYLFSGKHVLVMDLPLS